MLANRVLFCKDADAIVKGLLEIAKDIESGNSGSEASLKISI
jgi:hypothetical protein